MTTHIRCFITYPVIVIFLSLSLSGCNREGCTDANASNYEEKAESDDGTCRYESDPFEGRWNISDSIETSGMLIFEEVRVLNIRINSVDRSKVTFFFQNADGTRSDTLDANATPNTLSVPDQPFADSLNIQGNFIYSLYYGTLKTEYRISNAFGDIVQRRGKGIKIE